MKRFALIVDERVWQLLEAEQLPPFHPSLEWRDVTDVLPSPQERWGYNRSIGAYFAPQIPVQIQTVPTADEQVAALIRVLKKKGVLTEVDVDQEVARA